MPGKFTGRRAQTQARARAGPPLVDQSSQLLTNERITNQFCEQTLVRTGHFQEDEEVDSGEENEGGKDNEANGKDTGVKRDDYLLLFLSG